MEVIIRFVMLAKGDRFTVTDLCEQFSISRKTGYKHLERYAAHGLKGLQTRSHRPHQRVGDNALHLEQRHLGTAFALNRENEQTKTPA